MGLEKNIYKGIIFDSREEVWFAMWCEELKQAGLIRYWHKEIESIEVIPSYSLQYNKITELKTRTKAEAKSFKLLNNLSYTADFEISFTNEGFDIFVSPINENIKPDRYFFCYNPKNMCIIEVKPSFDQHGKTARFSLLQKMIWHNLGIFVDLIIPEDLFRDTFMPQEAISDFKIKRATAKKRVGEWKTSYIPKTLKQFLNDHTAQRN